MPPALDPEAETWAARFETVPPPAPPAEEPRRKRSGRWKTQVMGSMVPLEVAAAREEREPLSEPESRPAEVVPPLAVAPRDHLVAAAKAAPPEVRLRLHDVPPGWTPNLDPAQAWSGQLRDALLKQLAARRLCIAVTGNSGKHRAEVAGTLALAVAQAGASVLLVEADFDQPQLHLALAISAPSGAGFSQQLLGRRSDGLAQPWTVVRCQNNLVALVEGRMRSPGSSTSGAFASAVRELQGLHDVVILHAPALDRSGDLDPIRSVADGLVIVDAKHQPSFQLGTSGLDSKP